MSVLVVTGRIGKDAEVRETQGGTKVVSFSIADDIGWGDKKRTNWIKAAMFGERGVKVAPYLTKGSIVQVAGEADVEAWLKDGEPRAAIKLTVNDVKLFGGSKKDDDAPRNSGPARGREDDDIPFAPEVR